MARHTMFDTTTIHGIVGNSEGHARLKHDHWRSVGISVPPLMRQTDGKAHSNCPWISFQELSPYLMQHSRDHNQLLSKLKLGPWLRGKGSYTPPWGQNPVSKLAPPMMWINSFRKREIMRVHTWQEVVATTRICPVNQSQKLTSSVPMVVL